MWVNLVDRALAPVASWLQEGTMRRLGIERTMGLASRYNRFRTGRELRYREERYSRDFAGLLADNGPVSAHANEIRDGYVLDTSRDLLHLERLLRDAEEVIAERGAQSTPDKRYRAFFRNLLTPADLIRFPSFLDFVLSSDVLATVAEYFGSIPRLSDTLPPGVRFAESSKEMDAESHLPPRDSQLFHIDPYSRPMVYVIVTLRDVERPGHVLGLAGPGKPVPLGGRTRGRRGRRRQRRRSRRPHHRRPRFLQG